MKPLSKRHAAILDLLTAWLDDNDTHRRIDNRPGVYMAVVVEKIGRSRYSVAHYFEQNGDLVPDPDLEFVRQDDQWFPVACTQILGYRRVAETDDDGRIVKVSRRAYADLREFAGMMLTNIKEQQGDLTRHAPKREEATAQ